MHSKNHTVVQKKIPFLKMDFYELWRKAIVALTVLSALNAHSEARRHKHRDVEKQSLWPPGYHGYENMTQFLIRLSAAYPDQSYLYSAGKTMEGRDLWVLALAAEQPKEHVLFRPEISLMANMHGNEAVGKELLLRLAHYLLTQNGADQDVTAILQCCRIHIMPSINPDGFSVATELDCWGLQGRNNKNHVDINRDFPDRFDTVEYSRSRQPETLALMKWFDSVPFILSANLHGGVLVANYPWDNNKEYKKMYAKAPDDDILKHLAMLYSKSHPLMHKGEDCNDDFFVHGITNGADWYPVNGSLQDYQYAFKGTMALTLEVSCCKYPKSDALPELWNHNKDPLLKYLLEARRGVRGIVTDDYGMGVGSARLKIEGRELYFNATSTGEFGRVLLPNKYILSVEADGFANFTTEFEVPEEEKGYPAYTTLNITLIELNGQPKRTRVPDGKITEPPDVSKSATKSSGILVLFFSCVILPLLLA